MTFHQHKKRVDHLSGGPGVLALQILSLDLHACVMPVLVLGVGAVLAVGCGLCVGSDKTLPGAHLQGQRSSRKLVFWNPTGSFKTTYQNGEHISRCLQGRRKVGMVAN